MTKSFTLIELIIVMAIASILFALTSISVLRPQIKYGLDTQIELLLADIKSQQLNALISYKNYTNSADSYGIYFMNDRYILFKGAAYNQSDTNNKTILLDNGTAFNDINLPNNQIVFSRLYGEIIQYDNNSNNLQINKQGEVKTIVIMNKHGAVRIQ